MSSYSILGATGRVGGQILQHLLQENDSNLLHLYVRSKNKIFSAQPDLKNDPRVSIYEGDLHDVDVIKRCISGTKACFLAVALSENLPGCSIAQDTAKVVVQALDQLKNTLVDPTKSKNQNISPQLPRLVVLSSSSVSDKYWTEVPQLVHRVIYNANCNIYADLELAETYLRTHCAGLISLTFVKPGGLTNDIPRGYKLDRTHTHTPMSFADLAAAMVEVADTHGDTWDMSDVSIVPATEGQGARLDLGMPYALGKGLVACYLPWLYMYLRGWLP